MTVSSRTRDAQGSAAFELVLVAPVLLLILLLVVGLGRMAQAREHVEAAAADAARAASLERTKPMAATAAHAAAVASLDGAGLACSSTSVAVDLSDYGPGGSVRVSVICRSDLGDLVLSGLPGARRFSASVVVPIESHRAS